MSRRAQRLEKSPIEEKEITTINCIAHIRPSSDWKGIGYGFDWLRCGDYKEVLAEAGQDPAYAGGDTPYEQIVGYNYQKNNPEDLTWNANDFEGIFKKDAELYRKLEKEYRWIQIKKDSRPGKKVDPMFYTYRCPWLSLYPEATATLSLIVDVDSPEDVPDCLEIEYDTDSTEVAWTSEIPALTAGRNVLPDVLTVSCKKAFGREEHVDIYAIKNEKRKHVGQLCMWPNEPRAGKGMKKATVFFVNVDTINNGIAYNNARKTKIEKFIEENKLYFRQALIEIDGVFMNLPVYNDPHFQPGGHYYSDRFVVMSYMAYIENDVTTYPGMPDGFVKVNEYLASKLEAQPGLFRAGKSVRDCILVFFLDKPPASKTVDKTGKEKFSSTEGTHIKDSLHVLMSPNNAKTTSLTHEIGHALSLEHPFANRIVKGSYIAQDRAKYTFQALITHNIMDYSDIPKISPNVIPLYHFWKWQWEYMNKQITYDGKVKPPQKQ